jgi:type VI secretion system secreted protein VgrG
MHSHRSIAARRGRQRGLTTVEYVVVLVLVAIVGILAWRVFGERVRSKVELASLDLERLEEAESGQFGGPSGPAGPSLGAPGGGTLPVPAPGPAAPTPAPAAGVTPPSPPPPPTPPRPTTTGVPGLGSQADAIAGKSPTLSADVQKLSSQGWKVRYGTTGETGSFTDAANNTIVINSAYQNDPVQGTRSLSHEVGHALNPSTPVGFSGLTRAEYIAKNTDAALAGEGAATLYNTGVRAELLANGQPDITISGTQGPQYEAIYKQYKAGKITRAQAEQQIAQIYGAKETTSNSKQNYRTYYEQAYGKAWDKNYAGKPPTFRAP